MVSRESGKIVPFITIGWFAEGMGQGKPMKCKLNQGDDVMAVREHLNPQKYVNIYSPDLSYEKHLVSTGHGSALIRAVMDAACYFRYQKKHTDLPKFDSISLNPVTCATFVNTLFKKVGCSNKELEKMSDFFGLDVGECATVDLKYFSPEES